MELATDDQFSESLAALPPAPDHHIPSWTDSIAAVANDVPNFARDLTQPGFGHTGATVRAGFNAGIENDLSLGLSDDYVLAREYDPIVEALNKVQQRQASGDLIQNPYRGANITVPDPALAPDARQQAIDNIWQQVAIERQRNPGVFGQLPKDHAEVLADAQAEQRAALGHAQTLAQTGGPITGTAASFVGGAAASFADPINIAASAVGFPAAETLLKKVLIEGAGNAVLSLAGMPERVQHYAAIGEPMSNADVAQQVAEAGLFGAGIGAAGHAIGHVLGLHGPALVDAFDKANPDPAPGFRTAANIVEDRANLAATNPFADTAEGLDLHRQAMVQAQAAINDGRPDLLPDFADQIEARARAQAPEAFAEFEAAQQARDALRDQLDGLGAARADAPEAVAAQGQIDALLQKVSGVEERLTVAQRDRLTQARADLDAALSADTPEMGALREQLMAADYRMRDSGPGIAAAMRDAKVHVQADGGIRATGSFTTAKGSTYEVHGDGTTTRDKAPRPEHPGEEGPQPRSESTVYVTPDQADALSLVQAQGVGSMAIEPLPGGRVGVRYLEGPHAGKVERRTVVMPARDPAPGLLPVETWKNGTRVHFGNPITDVRQTAAARDGLRPLGGVTAADEGLADAQQHGRRAEADPEALKPFSDPIRKPEAFETQARDLARELAPAPETPKPELEPAARDSGEAVQAETKSPYGEAAPEIEALERLPQDDLFPNPATGALTPIKAATAEAKLAARAVERLRGCVEEE